MTDSEKRKLIISTAPTPNPSPNDTAEELDNHVEMELRQASVPVNYHASRLDLTLAGIVPEFSRSYLQQLIEAGMVRLRGQVVTKTSIKVKAGDELSIELRPTPQSQAFKPEPMSLDIVYEDEFLYVINKPAGMVVHPAPGNWSGTLLNGLLAHDPKASFLPRAGIVHRLDKDTSGLMVVARQRTTMDQLVELIAARKVHREYVAVVHGAWQGAATRQVDVSIGRDPRNRLRMAVVDLERNAGKTALTKVTFLNSNGPFSVVKCKLHTGRTHQIRVHMAFLGHPLVSDEVYGGPAAAGLTRQALHAYRLAFDHPVSGKAVSFTMALPEDLQNAMVNLGLGYNLEM